MPAKRRTYCIGLILAFSISIVKVQAYEQATSSSYILFPMNFGNSGGIQSSSSSYNMDFQQVGDFTTGHSTSSSYDTLHGYLYPDVTDMIIQYIAIPEKRIPSTGHYASNTRIEIRTVGSSTALAEYENLLTGNTEAKYPIGWTGSGGVEVEGLSDGTYDVVVKGYSTLARKKTVSLVTGINQIDFTDSGNNPLKVGDVYVSTSYPHGDNMVNSVDMTYLVSQWNETDTGISDNRADVDENDKVNSLDMTKVVANYAQVGD